MSQYFEGRVHTVVYADEGAAFYILKVALDTGEGSNLPTAIPSFGPPVTVRGHIPGMAVKVNTWISFKGEWNHHPKYGKQLKITKAPVLKKGWTPDTAIRALSGEVAESLLEHIRTALGDDKFLEALGDAEILRGVSGVTKYAAQQIEERWGTIRALFETLHFLNNLKIPPARVRNIWQVFKDDAEKVLSKNPWALVQIEGISFAVADEVAQRLGLSLESPLRVEGAVLYACQTQGGKGHLYFTTGELFAEVKNLISLQDPKKMAHALKALHDKGSLVLDRDTRPGTLAVYEPWAYEMEKESSRLLLERLTSASYDTVDPGEYIKNLGNVGPLTERVSALGDLMDTICEAVAEWGDQASISLSPSQEEGVINALRYPVSLLVGLPGSGKTTSLKAAVNILQDAEVPFLLCAPTGIAAKRLSALTGAKAYTIHRAFAAQGESDDERESTYTGIVGEAKSGSGGGTNFGVWKYGPHRPHPARVVIVDESSMVDQHLLYRLLSCTADNCRVVFVGDHAQLPSVGAGNVLRGMIESGRFPTVKLTTIFRQEDASGIVFAAHAMHRGEVPEVKNDGDFVLLEIEDEGRAQDAVVALATRLYQKRLDFQVLSPRHGGALGVTALNRRLREVLNPEGPGLGEIRLGEDTIREGDRVMVVKNNYSLEVFNGDVGSVKRVDHRARLLQVKIFGVVPKLVDLEFKNVTQILRLAYATTIHKAQGLEYDMIVAPILPGFQHQLQRNLYYTAITRAKKRVFLIGTRGALARAVSNHKEDARNSLFVDRLCSAKS